MQTSSDDEDDPVLDLALHLSKDDKVAKGVEMESSEHTPLGYVEQEISSSPLLVN